MQTELRWHPNWCSRLQQCPKVVQDAEPRTETSVSAFVDKLNREVKDADAGEVNLGLLSPEPQQMRSNFPVAFLDVQTSYNVSASFIVCYLAHVDVQRNPCVHRLSGDGCVGFAGLYVYLYNADLCARLNPRYDFFLEILLTQKWV